MYADQATVTFLHNVITQLAHQNMCILFLVKQTTDNTS